MLHDETSPTVAAEIAIAERQQVANNGELYTSHELSLFQTKLPSAPELVRREIISALGVVCDKQKAARDVLAWWFYQEPLMPLKQMIGQHVPAAELAMAAPH
jgi:hypothetical protein